MMQKLKTGLQKGITTIFEGVRIPEDVHPQQPSGAPAPGGADNLGPKPLSPDKQVPPARKPLPRSWAAPVVVAPKRSKVASIIKTFKEMPLRIFRPGAKRTERRRSVIAKHLLT
jgi:hypothetical protein